MAFLFLFQFLLLLMPAGAFGKKYRKFPPEDLDLYHGGLDKVPGLFDLGSSLTEDRNLSVNSFWTSSYITTRGGESFLVITHIIEQGTIITRSSVYNLDTHAYSQTQNISDDAVFYNSKTGLLDVEGPGGFRLFATSDTDPLDGLHVITSVPDVGIDLTFNTRSAALVNGGTGAFVLAGDFTYEWAVPEAKTTGSLTVNGTKLEVDSARSLTWIDRQFNDVLKPTITTKTYVGAASWHWFQLHLRVGSKGTRVPFSSWAITYENGLQSQFASIRTSPGIQQLIPVNKLDTTGRTWTSPNTNITYELDYKLSLQDGSYFEFSLEHGNQEMQSDNGASAAYEGYLEFTGVYQGKPVTGFGLVEIVKNNS